MATNDGNEKTKFIETKLPLPWLLSTAAATILSLGGVFMKLDILSQNIAKLESKTDIRDERIAALNQNLLLQQGRNDTQQTQINRNMEDIADIKKDIADIRNKR